jgi:hypothetical protein
LTEHRFSSQRLVDTELSLTVRTTNDIHVSHSH